MTKKDDIAELQPTVCDSCGQTKVLSSVQHHQEGNDKTWYYCDRCKLAHEIEAETQKRLVELMSTDPIAANNPVEVAKIRAEVAKELSPELVE
jgi:hypothetical protein